MKQKGCIIEIRDDSAVVMTSSCDFVKVSGDYSGFIPGMEIEFAAEQQQTAVHPESRRAFWKGRMAGVVAVAAVFMMLIVGAAIHLIPASHPVAFVMSIDINPSLAISLDSAGYIIEAEALNEKSEELDLSGLRRKSLEEGIGFLVADLTHQGYFQRSKTTHLLLAAAPVNPEDQWEKLDNILLRAGTAFENEAVAASVHLETLSLKGDNQHLAGASERRQSVGKLVLSELYGQVAEPEMDRQQPAENEISVGEMMRVVKEKREHPVFDEHPSLYRNDTQAEESDSHPVFDEHPSQRLEDETDINDREHPVFNQHPGKGEKPESGETDDSHPVFDEHPGQGNPPGEASSSAPSDNPAGQNHASEDGELSKSPEEGRPHPVFEENPGKGKKAATE